MRRGEGEQWKERTDKKGRRRDHKCPLQKNVEPKQAVLWVQMQREAQVAACVDSSSRIVEV